MTSKITRQGGQITEVCTYEYNLQNRLSKVTTTPYADGQPQTPEVVEYEYNPDGIRTRKITGGVTEICYLIDPHNPTGYAQVLEESQYDITTSASPVLESVIYYTLGDDVISQTQCYDSGSGWQRGDSRCLLYDGHGSTRQLVDGSLNVIDAYNYDGYGVFLQNASADPGITPPQDTSLLYAGEMFDFSSQFYYNRARWYNPLNGRFNRLDPFAGSPYDPPSLHKYLYCHANPINGLDPSGMSINWGVLGKWIHSQIGSMYESEHIGTIYLGKSIPGIRGDLMPDIMDFALKEIAEIKPLSHSGMYTGPFQLGTYLAVANALGIPGAVDKIWTPSTWDVGIRNIPLPPHYAKTMIALTLGNANGLVFYKVFEIPDNKMKTFLLAGLMASLADRFKNMAQQIRSLVRQGYNNLEGNLAYFSQEADAFFTLAYSQRYERYGMNVSTQYLIGGLLLMTGIAAINDRFGYI